MASKDRDTGSTIGPRSDIGSIWQEAVVRYEATTKIKISSLSRPRNVNEILDISKQSGTKFSSRRHDGSRLDRFRSSIARSLHPIELLGDIVTNASKTIFPPAEIIFAAVRYLINTANATSADFDRVEEFFEDMASYLTQLQVWEHNLPRVPELEEVITEIFTSILVLCGICTRYIQKGRLVKAFRALAGEDNELKSALENFQKTILKEQGIVRNAILLGVERIDLGTAAMHSDVRTNLAMTDEVHTYIKSQENELERDKILAWLSSLTFEDKQRETHTRHYKGTCGWFFSTDEFKQWFHGKSNSTLWCSGIPGAGKSVMTSVAISYIEEHTKRTDVAIAYVYCDYKNQATQSPIELISSITRQLVEQTHPIPQVVKTYRDKWVEKRSLPTDEERISLVKDIVSMFNTTFVFVDALDECAEHHRDELLRMLEALQSSVRLFMTSRPLPELYNEFTNLSCIDITASHSDLRTYLEAEIGNNRRMSSFITKDATLKLEIINVIVEKAEGMFLVAYLQIDFLCRKTSVKQVRQSLDTLPTKIYDFYEEALARLEDQSEDDEQLAKRALTFLSCARRPLTVEELCQALSICLGDTELDETAFPDIEIILNTSIGLIRLDDRNNLTALVHHTLQEFFIKYPTRLSAQPELEVATACLSYLSLDVFENGPCPESDSLEQRLQDYQFYAYASNFCGSHLLENRSEESTELLKSFIMNEQKVASCLQVLYIPRIRSQGWHECFPTQSSPLHLAALWGLEWCISMLLEEHVNIHSQDSHGSSALHLAARHGHLAAAQLLCQAGAQVDARNHKGETALYWAARNGHKAIVELLLAHKADVMAEDFEEWSPLDWAVIGGYTQLVKLLLDCRDAAISSADQLSRALILAAETGNEITVRMLIDAGVDVNYKDHRGSTPLAWAVPEGHEEVTRMLLDNGADVNSEDNYGNTILHWSLPYPKIIGLLIERGADIDAKTGTEQTALIWAAQNGQETAMQLLLDRNADVSAQDDHGCTALHAAALKGHARMVDILMQNGSDPDKKDHDEWTPLHAAAIKEHSDVVSILLDKTSAGEEIVVWVASQQKQARKRALFAHLANRKSNGSTVVSGLGSAVQDGQLERVRALLETGVDINARDGCGSTPLTLATSLGRENMTQFLLEQGADVNKRETNGYSALHVATELGRYSIVELLVEKGADIDAEIHTWTPLLIASAKGWGAMVDYLVNNGANVNAGDYYGRRALHWCAWYPLRLTVQLLINHGALVNATDHWGRTPLTFAIEGDNPGVVTFLLRMGADANSKMLDNTTPLHLASYFGNKKVVSLLLEEGADINATTQNGYQPWHIATLFEHKDVAQLLSQKDDGAIAAQSLWPETDANGQESDEEIVDGYIGVADRASYLRPVICLDKRIRRRLKGETVEETEELFLWD